MGARALVAIPLLFGTWVVAPNLREYALIDPLAWAFVAGIWLCTLRRQWLAVAVLGAVGVVAKEVVLLAVVAAAAAAWSADRVWRPLLVALPGLLVVLLLTLLFPGSGTDAGGYLLKWIQDGLGSLGVPRILYLIFASYGALWLLVPSWLPRLAARTFSAPARCSCWLSQCCRLSARPSACWKRLSSRAVDGRARNVHLAGWPGVAVRHRQPAVRRARWRRRALADGRCLGRACVGVRDRGRRVHRRSRAT